MPGPGPGPRKRMKRTDNPLYHNFGVFSNTIYCIKSIKKYCPVIFIILLFQIFSESAFDYFWGIASKYIIQIIQLPVAMEEKQSLLIKTVCILSAFALTVQFIRITSQTGSWWRLIKIRMNLITERVEKVLTINYEYLESPEVLDIHQRAANATDNNESGIEGMMHIMQRIGTSLCTLIVTFVAVTVLDWRLIIVLFITSLMNFFAYKHIIKIEKPRVWDILAPNWRKTHYLKRKTQDFDAAKDIRLFDLNEFLLNKLRGVHAFKESKIDFHENCWTCYALFTQSISIISQFCIYGVLIYAVIGRDMSIANFSMYLGFAMAFSSSLVKVLQLFGDYVKASLQVDDFRSFMNVKNELNEIEEKEKIPETDKYEIQFHNVTYKYPETEKPALSNLNLTLHPGEKLAVVGLNGAGKTTMIKLLLRLYDPTEGYITLNGIDIRKFDRKAYYDIFSPVFQDVEVFAFPISQNVSMNNLLETDREQVIKAIKDAGLDDKLETLPKGIDTQLLKVIDESGIDLSGGQRQRLALARALYKGAPIVVLDEPTSALDALAEKNLYERFDSMIGDKSSVYISHRLASTRFCNKIAMFMNGEMVEYGTHEELIAKKGEYAHMFEVQSQYYVENKEQEEN